MRDEERKIVVECEACLGTGYLCECEKDGKVSRWPDPYSEECDYCAKEVKNKNKYVCNYCDGRGVVDTVEHVAVEG